MIVLFGWMLCLLFMLFVIRGFGGLVCGLICCFELTRWWWFEWLVGTWLLVVGVAALIATVWVVCYVGLVLVWYVYLLYGVWVCGVCLLLRMGGGRLLCLSWFGVLGALVPKWLVTRVVAFLDLVGGVPVVWVLVDCFGLPFVMRGSGVIYMVAVELFCLCCGSGVTYMVPCCEFVGLGLHVVGFGLVLLWFTYLLVVVGWLFIAVV